MSQIAHILEKCGKFVAGFWLGLLGFALLLSFLVSGLVASFFVGVGAAWLVGYGTLGAIVFFVSAFSFGLFLSVYVWQPHVRPVILEMVDYLTKRQP
ncbi:MAG: hypothetical protein P4M07_00390 [Xanthobacteraceae bacterium]|nr:hypothetical protein [Xanthobacteraceae bacterium]